MLEIILILAVLGVDQLVKYLSELYLSPVGTSVPVVEGVFHFTSTHNAGAAWGMLQGKRWFFLILTAVICTCIVIALFRLRKKMSVLSRVTLCLLLAGALGNAIDRAVFAYVRDMFDFRLINFPVFNVADCSLTIGCILMMVDALFMKERSMFEIKLRLPKREPDLDAKDG